MIPRYVGNKRKASLTTPTIDENRGFEAVASSEATEACPHRNVEHISELDLILSGEFLMLGEPGPPETQSEPGATPPNRWLKNHSLALHVGVSSQFALILVSWMTHRQLVFESSTFLSFRTQTPHAHILLKTSHNRLLRLRYLG